MKFDNVKKLQQKKYREQFGAFLVEGEHLVLELQKAAATDARWQHCTVYATHAHADWEGPFGVELISEGQFAQIADTKNPQGILAVAPIPSQNIAPQAGERAIYLHEIQDPGNLGTILRTLAWFGGLRCLLGPGSVDAYNPKVVRASMGAIFHVPIEVDVTPAQLAARYPRLACLDMDGSALPDPAFADFDAYVFGNEARGLPRGVFAAQPFTVAGGGAIDSLNLASSVTICAYELQRAGVNQ